MAKKRPKHYKEYENMVEIVPGVFVDQGSGVYIVDDEGEVCCWVETEWTEDPEAVTATVNAVALAAAKGTAAVRKNLNDPKGFQIANLVNETFDKTH